MGERKFTFIELHLDGDTQFGPRTLDALPLPEGVVGSASEDESELETDASADVAVATEDEDEAEDQGSAGKAIGALLALAILVVAGIAVRKYRGEDEDAERTEQEPDVVVN
ncbi:hypothetical protein [Halobiforma nitratireducens]|uniref:Uncharacterized protein n=1 Tax=Halobiforma nitratireducens JCM 10879 TaxID=1227454 RepID=M0LXF9_9EURY|nr:hypothetical protein [Halobiforma nitratireducens]EMA36795.1 hypothetical protein C446_11322 [Halobiforma nitratireducens JCM 10879]